MEVFIAGVRHVPTDIEINAGSARHGAGYPQSNRILRREMADALQAMDKDWICGEQVLVLVDFLRKRLDECLHASKKIERLLQRQSANADVAGHHSLAADCFKEPQDFFTLAEGIKKNGQRTNVHGVGTQPDQVRVEPCQLREHYPHPLRLGWNFEIEKLLHGQGIAQVVDHRRQIVDAVCERDHLVIKLGLTGFLDARVQVSDFGIEPDYGFAVDFEHEAQHAMRGRM